MASADDKILTRDVEATLIPHGQPYTLEEGQQVVITHRLGGNFTVLAGGSMFRIAAKDADALGEASDAPGPTEKEAQPVDEPPSEEAIRDKLKQVYDPEIPVNIVDLGLVYNTEVAPVKAGTYSVHVDMTLTAPGCGMGPMIADDAKQRILELPGIAAAEVEIVWDPPWNQEMISEEGKMILGLI